MNIPAYLVFILLAIATIYFAYIPKAANDPTDIAKPGGPAADDIAGVDENPLIQADVLEEGAPQGQDATLGSIQGGDSEQPAVGIVKPTTKQRYYYLDNVKSFLTVIVVIHHITCTFAGGGWYYGVAAYQTPFTAPFNMFLTLNQSYFMCLFFFISGYFSPSSLERKGRFAFLQDKFRRLGQPFVFFLFVMGPLLTYFVQVCEGDGESKRRRHRHRGRHSGVTP